MKKDTRSAKQVQAMSVEEQAAFVREYTSVYHTHDAYGVDLSLLRANLKLTPTERLRRMPYGLTGPFNERRR